MVAAPTAPPRWPATMRGTSTDPSALPTATLFPQVRRAPSWWPARPDVAPALPAGERVDLAGRGRTLVVDRPGPVPDAPPVVLLHPLSCTAHLAWSESAAALGARHRLIALDQRWHGRGIRSDRFRLEDCADDVAALLDHVGLERAVLLGYSMGGAVAQLTWRRHPDRVAGLVLGSTARHFTGRGLDRVAVGALGALGAPAARATGALVDRHGARLSDVPDLGGRLWRVDAWRATSAWHLPEVLGELGRFDSRGWAGRIDVPTAVLVTEGDRTVPARRQRELAEAVPGATAWSVPGGHTSLILGVRRWAPVAAQALAQVVARAQRRHAA